MSTRRNRRRQHRKHKREAARRTRNRLHRLRLGWTVSDEPVTATELARWFEERLFRPNDILVGMPYVDEFIDSVRSTPLPPVTFRSLRG